MIVYGGGSRKKIIRHQGKQNWFFLFLFMGEDKKNIKTKQTAYFFVNRH